MMSTPAVSEIQCLRLLFAPLQFIHIAVLPREHPDGQPIAVGFERLRKILPKSLNSADDTPIVKGIIDEERWACTLACRERRLPNLNTVSLK
jgi:hypothetical protein